MPYWLLTAVDPSSWPEVDSQPLSLEDSWRLRVASAQVFSIVKNRHTEHFERAMGFLEATYTLLPRLVAPIKHMKIMFGLKTMAIMWMLREGRGMVDTVFKINQFFPSKLPQYQDHCNQHEMFLMRKNHLDFKALAQALATDKDRLEGYMMNQMEEQYGEHYAQKVEDRLLHYLRELETVLPGDTYIDKILKKKSPVTEEEKLLLEVITSDSRAIATTLEKLLHCDAKTPLEFQPEDFRGGEEADQDVSKDSPLLLDSDNDSDVTRHQQTEEDCEVVRRLKEESSDKEKEGISQRSSDCVQEATYSSQFCFKHQRWVKSILQECPDEYSEELLLQANVSLSPPLFHSSSSITSSQDLTPSDLIPYPPDQRSPSPETSAILQTAAQACEQANSGEKLSSGLPLRGFASDASQRESLRQPSSSRDSLVPAWSETNRVRRPQLRLSVPSQAVLLQSKLLQPYVSLTRLSAQECYQVTKGRSSTRPMPSGAAKIET
ncbi:uncharacterized protein [Chaetodon trifascialis]|uniref:uncharacterized protein n=1 Tax=Chaetodon trifascialis TaxID=109706 RepID=UPI003995287D